MSKIITGNDRKVIKQNLTDVIISRTKSGEPCDTGVLYREALRTAPRRAKVLLTTSKVKEIVKSIAGAEAIQAEFGVWNWRWLLSAQTTDLVQLQRQENSRQRATTRRKTEITRELRSINPEIEALARRQLTAGS